MSPIALPKSRHAKPRSAQVTDSVTSNPVVKPLPVKPLPTRPRETARPVQSAATLYSEDLQVGDCWTTELREITSKDVTEFASLTGDHTPLHDDDDTASPYGKPIAHGLLGLSILAGLGTNYPKASTLAFVSIEEWQFLAPVFFGDKVRARNEIIQIDPHGRRAVKVRWLRQLLNGEGRVVQQGHFITLVGSKNRVSQKPR